MNKSLLLIMSLMAGPFDTATAATRSTWDADQFKYLLVPDRFQIATVFEQPRFSLVEKANASGFKVSISYSADYSRLEKFLFSSHENDFFQIGVFKAEANPIEVQHLSKIFDEPTIVSWSVVFDINEIHLTYDFSNELDRTAIEALFKGPFIIGNLVYQVTCGETIRSTYCDSNYSSVPLFNQFVGDVHQQDYSAYQTYRLLQNYLNYSVIFHPLLKGANSLEVDQHLRKILFEGDVCQSDLSSTELAICQSIIERSPNLSVHEALEKAKGNITEFIELSTSDSFILGRDDFQILHSSPIRPDPDSWNQSAYDPAFANSKASNEWYIIFAAEAESLVLQIKDGESYSLKAHHWGEHSSSGTGLERLKQGTQIRLIARHSDGEVAATEYFAYLDEEPKFQSASQQRPQSETISYTANSSEWWVEFASDADSIKMEIEGDDTYELKRHFWGVFSSSETGISKIPLGTGVRLTLTYNEERIQTTKYFRYLVDEPLVN
ncbi:MAG: hypothetical protein HRU19_03710 [Pseudobacteriovorax sp.]|nr:hypothetical protein [Pseudobacteriovorax sp.]